VPPFAATLTILMLLPDAPVAQPYALIAGSVCGAAVGTGVSFFGSGLGMAVLAMIAAFVFISLIHAYHPQVKSPGYITHYTLSAGVFDSPFWVTLVLGQMVLRNFSRGCVASFPAKLTPCNSIIFYRSRGSKN
jgi:HPP family